MVDFEELVDLNEYDPRVEVDFADVDNPEKVAFEACEERRLGSNG